MVISDEDRSTAGSRLLQQTLQPLRVLQKRAAPATADPDRILSVVRLIRVGDMYVQQQWLEVEQLHRDVMCGCATASAPGDGAAYIARQGVHTDLCDTVLVK